MDRKEFIQKAGMGAMAVLTISCFGGCTKEPLVRKPLKAIDFEIDLSDPKFDALKDVDGYVLLDDPKVIIVRYGQDEYIAATKYCTHESLPDLKWGQKDYHKREFVCTAHFATFDKEGIGTGAIFNKPSTNSAIPIEVYKTELVGTTLKITSK